MLVLPGGARWAVEVKRSLSPRPERGFYSACADIAPERRWVVYPGTERYPLGNDVEAVGLANLCALLASD